MEHRQPALRRGVYLSLLALGIFSQLAQALLGRELLVVFYGNEVSLGAFYGCWLLWIAVGALAVARLRRRGWLAEPLPAFRTCLLLLPLLLLLQVAAARSVRAFMDVGTAELVSLEQLLVATLLVTLPCSLAAGVAFPLGCEILALSRRPRQQAATQGRAARHTAAADVGDVSHLYVLEAAGALLGGALFTFVIVDWLGGWRSVGFGALVMAFAASSLTPRSRRLGPAVVVLALGGLAVVATPVGSWLHRWSETARFATLHSGLTLLDSVETRYGHVAIAQLGEQRSIVFDGRIATSFPDPKAVAQEAAYSYSQAPGARRVLLFGGVASGLAAELLRYPVARLDVVEEDERAFQRIRPHLDPDTVKALGDPRLSLHFEDGRRFVNRQVPPLGEPERDSGWDLVVISTPDPASAYLNRYYTLDFYQSLAVSMTAGGVICTAVTSASSYLGRDVKSYSGSVLHTLAAVFSEVAVAPGDSHTFCASNQAGQVSTDPAELARRYRATAVTGRSFPPSGFEALLPPGRVAFVRAALQQQRGELNTDQRPTTYFLNMLLWGKYTSSSFVEGLQTLRRMGLWSWLAPLFIAALLLPLRAALEGQRRVVRRRSAATFALAVLGFVAMAAQLQLLLSYQAQVGFVFGRIALLNGLFMTGLALGAGVLGTGLAKRRRPGLSLGILLTVVALACHALPAVLAALATLQSASLEASYLALVCAAGVLTGAGFPLGVQLAHQQHGDVIRTSGLVEAADHLGGAVGGILAGAVLVPLLGIAGSSRLLAFAALLAMVPVALAERAPHRGPTPEQSPRAGRGYVSFPFVRLSWALGFVVLTGLLLTHLVRDATGPRVLFDDDTLASVSGSAQFELSRRPMVHYLGQGGLAAPARTVSLATMTVAADVEGYGGPLNLLVSVDDRGTLRGIRYLESDETPAYIGGIENWLRALVGRDLSHQALSTDSVDVISGATITSVAALQSINRAARAGAAHGLGTEVAPQVGAAEPGLAEVLLTPKVALVALFLAAFFPVFLIGKERARLAYQVGSVVILGWGLNTLVSEIDVLNLSAGRLPSLASNPSWTLLLVFIGVTALLWGPVYCGYVCPFGALQELVSRLGRRLRLQVHASPWLDQRMRYAKYLLWSVTLLACWVTGDLVWVSFNPMQHLFGPHLGGWMGVLAGASLIGALSYYRFWCRYFCPFGALLALSNKLAFWQGVAPQRRFERCDLGVRAQFDVDCIRCGRCVTDVDLVGRRKRRRAAAPGRNRERSP